MRVFLDDERSTPEGWVHAYWPDLIDSENNMFDAKFDFVSLDPEDCTVGYKCAELNSKTTRRITDK